MHVTVVITCYNYGPFLAGCLRSVLAQTYAAFDVVVVDDGSTDDSAEVVSPFLADPRVRYYYQSNKGQAAAKNVGIVMARGDVVAFLDADDVWMPDKLATQMPLFERAEVGVVYSGIGLIDQEGQAIPFDGPTGYWQYRRGRVTKWLAFDNFVPFSSSMVRRRLFDEHGRFDERLRMGIDWDLWLRLSMSTEFDFVPARLVQYRRGHALQMSKDWDGRVAAADTIFRRFLDAHPDALTSAELRRVRLYNACSRADGYRAASLNRSTALLMRAVRMAPWSTTPYRGLLRNARALVQRVHHLGHA